MTRNRNSPGSTRDPPNHQTTFNSLMANTSVKYKLIAKAMREEIRRGAYKDGDSFPSLTKIMRRFGISRPSAVRCIAELKRMGVLKTEKGRGTFVSHANKTIGLVIPGSSDSEFFAAVMTHLVAACHRYGMDLVAGGAFPPGRRQRAIVAERLVRHFIECKVAGVIMQPVAFTENAGRVNRTIARLLDKAKIPVVLIDCDIIPQPGRSRYDLVAIDNFAAGRRMAARLAASGAKRICCLRRRLSADSVWIRFSGVEAFAARTQGVETAYIDAEPDDAAALRAAIEKLRPDAIVCPNDQAAAILAQTLETLGLEIPRDVMLAGFDDVRVARRMDPPLTTIRQPCADLASMAFRTLVERIQNPSLPPREILLTAPLAVRASTKRQ